LTIASANKTLSTEKKVDLSYENCRPDDEIYGKKVGRIVGYALEVMGITGSTINAKQSYVKYVRALQEMLGGSEPTHKSLKLAPKADVVKEILQFLPNQVPKNLLKKIANQEDSDSQNVYTGIDRPKHILRRDNERNFDPIEYVGIKVFKYENQLEIIPTYISVAERKKESRILFVNWSETEIFIEFKQQKFFLTRYEIQEITKELISEEKKWNINNQNREIQF
jgi:hypothetical protein